MNMKSSKLFSATAFVALAALAGSVTFTGIAAAADKKADRLPVAAAAQCNSQILGTMSDECLQKVVEGAKIKTVKTTVIEVRDEAARISTLIRVPDVEFAQVEQVQQ